MTVIRTALLLISPTLLTGCLIPTTYDIPMAAVDPLWDKAVTVTAVEGGMVTINGETTEIAGLDTSSLSPSEQREFEAALSEKVLGKQVVVQPVGPGKSRLLMRGELDYHNSWDYQRSCAIPIYPLYVAPRFVPATPDRIDVGEELLTTGLIGALPDEVAEIEPLPVKPHGLFFRPEFPLRLLSRRRPRTNFADLLVPEARYREAAETAADLKWWKLTDRSPKSEAGILSEWKSSD